jgi:hypothetical protein
MTFRLRREPSAARSRIPQAAIATASSPASAAAEPTAPAPACPASRVNATHGIKLISIFLEFISVALRITSSRRTFGVVIQF